MFERQDVKRSQLDTLKASCAKMTPEASTHLFYTSLIPFSTSVAASVMVMAGCLVGMQMVWVVSDTRICVSTSAEIHACVRVYIYIYIYVCVCVHACVCACICVYLSEYIYYICIHILLHSFKYAHMHIYVCVCVCVCVCMFLYMCVFEWVQ